MAPVHQPPREPAAPSLRAAVASLLAQRGWSLLSEDELVAEVQALLAEGSFADPGLAGLRSYAQTLYRACLGQEGADRQAVAYQELSRYFQDVLWRIAADLTPDEREEVANQTLAEVFFRLTGQGHPRRLSAVREPGAFLAVAIQQLRNVVRRWRRDPFTVNLEVDEGLSADSDQHPERLAETQELSERVRRCFQASLRRHPRARLQLGVVWQRQMLGLDYETISAQSQMSVTRVRLLHYRGLDKLRLDPDWHALALELGLEVRAEPVGAYARPAGAKGVV